MADDLLLQLDIGALMLLLLHLPLLWAPSKVAKRRGHTVAPVRNMKSRREGIRSRTNSVRRSVSPNGTGVRCCAFIIFSAPKAAAAAVGVAIVVPHTTSRGTRDPK